MSNKQYLGVMGLIILIVMTVFYWYSYRPSQVKKECSKRSLVEADDYANSVKTPEFLRAGYKVRAFDNLYSSCLKEKGL